METYVTEEIARRFLLGDVDESECQRIEELVILEPEVKQTLLIAEEDLIEEYLDDDLSPSDKEKFVTRYANTAPQRRKLEIGEAIRRRAKEPSLAPGTGTSVKWLPNFLSSLWLRRRPLLIPATALAVVLIFASIWFIGWNNRRLQERNQRDYLAQQLYQLNSPQALRNNPTQMLVLAVSPGSTRGTRPPAQVASRSPYKIFELQLLWIQTGEYERYEAVIRRVGTDERFIVPDLHRETTTGRHIKLRVSDELLHRGLYQISLSSFAKDGAPGPVEEYMLEVGN